MPLAMFHISVSVQVTALKSYFYFSKEAVQSLEVHTGTSLCYISVDSLVGQLTRSTPHPRETKKTTFTKYTVSKVNCSCFFFFTIVDLIDLSSRRRGFGDAAFPSAELFEGDHDRARV